MSIGNRKQEITIIVHVKWPAGEVLRRGSKQ